jgi:hypothetical protein
MPSTRSSRPWSSRCQPPPESERAELDRLWRQRLERAAFEADRAARHYRLVEPENRLVARVLAQEWEAKLTAQEQLQADYQRFLPEQPRTLSEAERGTLQALAENLPALWATPTTTVAERKDLIREVIQQIRGENEAESERLHVSIDGERSLYHRGGHSSHQPDRALEYYPELWERGRRRASQGLGAESIAEDLAHAGYRPPKQAERFSRQAVRELLQRLGVRSPRLRTRASLGHQEGGLADLARTLSMPDTTLDAWVRRGGVQARQEPETQRWILGAEASEVERLRQRRAVPAGH